MFKKTKLISTIIFVVILLLISLFVWSKLTTKQNKYDRTIDTTKTSTAKKDGWTPTTYIVPSLPPFEKVEKDTILESKAPLKAKILIPAGATYQVDRSGNNEVDTQEGYHVQVNLSSGVVVRFCWGCIPIMLPNDQTCRDLADKYKSDNILGGCSTRNVKIGNKEFEEYYSVEKPNELEFALYAPVKGALYSVTVDPGSKHYLTEVERAAIGRMVNSVSFDDYLK